VIHETGEIARIESLDVLSADREWTASPSGGSPLIPGVQVTLNRCHRPSSKVAANRRDGNRLALLEKADDRALYALVADPRSPPSASHPALFRFISPFNLGEATEI
jgi:hypothetical protein